MLPILTELSALLGPAGILTDRASIVACSAAVDYARKTPELPLAVCRPTLPKQVGGILAACSHAGVPVIIRGLGTEFSRPAKVVPKDAILILSTGLRRVYEIDAVNRIAHVEAGITLSELQDAAAKKGLFYPGGASGGNFGTLGGNLAVNKSRSLKYGAPGDYALELECYCASGEKLTCANQNFLPGHMFAGFPLAPLMCGSYGALGVITSCRLRLEPLPSPSRSFWLYFRDCPDLCATATTMLASGLQPDFLDFFDPVCAEVISDPGNQRGWLLTGAFSGDESEACAAQAREICESNKGEASNLNYLADSGCLWPRLSARYPFTLLDLGCKPSDLGRFLREAANIMASLKAPMAGQADLARVTVAVPEGEDTRALKRNLFNLELMANDSLQSESDSELGRQAWQERYSSGREISAALRKLMDPAGILALAPLPGSQING